MKTEQLGEANVKIHRYKPSGRQAVVQSNELVGKSLGNFGDAFDSLIVQLTSGWPIRLGCSELFNQTQSLPFFPDAQRVWLDAMRRHCFGKRFKNLSAPHVTQDLAKELVLWLVSGAEKADSVIQKYVDVIRQAAIQADVQFFRRLGQSLGRKRSTKQPLSMDILIFWINGLLWLMSNADAATALGHYAGRKISEDDYKAECRRLKLLRCTRFGIPPAITCQVFRAEIGERADRSDKKHEYRVKFTVTEEGAKLNLKLPL